MLFIFVQFVSCYYMYFFRKLNVRLFVVSGGTDLLLSYITVTLPVSHTSWDQRTYVF